MDRLKNLFIISFLAISVTGCQSIKEKTDDIIKKENQKLSEYIGKNSNDLKIDLGKPDKDFKNEVGNTIFVYQSKKYGIPCERKFEINDNNIIEGFSSSGCI